MDLKEHLTRQAEIIPSILLDREIFVVGAGAIGSWVIMSLTKMGFENITVFDGDDVTIENMNCQFYPYKAIGENKALYLKRLCKGFANVNISAHDEMFNPDTHGGLMRGSEIVISSVDSMSARKMIWDTAKYVNIPYLIDPRMGAEMSLMYTMSPVDPKDINSYEKTLYSDESAVQERCTAKATIYTANLLAGQVCKAVKDLTVGKPYTRISQWNIAENACVMHNTKHSG